MKNKTWLLQGKIRWPLRATVIFYLCLEVILFAVSLFLLLRGYFFCRDSCGPPYILLNKKQRIRMEKDYYSDNDLRFSLLNGCAQLPKCQFCKRHVRFWVLSPKDYKESEDAFKKVIWDTVGFEDYFLGKVHRHKSALRKGERFGHFSQVTWCP